MYFLLEHISFLFLVWEVAPYSLAGKDYRLLNTNCKPCFNALTLSPQINI